MEDSALKLGGEEDNVLGLGAMEKDVSEPGDKEDKTPGRATRRIVRHTWVIKSTTFWSWERRRMTYRSGETKRMACVAQVKMRTTH